ncbi:unnamed protein product [Echinostoma caproni]|uniref:Uncharacterized protein n=1 Tax=Echinostoma caproni TaxID=27848 RepID=A0A183BCV8_9TREM|nr:unnamed protein product [Echinostoma caproni]
MGIVPTRQRLSSVTRAPQLPPLAAAAAARGDCEATTPITGELESSGPPETCPRLVNGPRVSDTTDNTGVYSEERSSGDFKLNMTDNNCLPTIPNSVNPEMLEADTNAIQSVSHSDPG